MPVGTPAPEALEPAFTTGNVGDMAWWTRLILTLVLAPILWRLVDLYIETQQGGVLADLLVQSGPVLGKVYLAYTLPAAALLLVLLLPADLLLRRLGLDLLIVAVGPLLACAAPIVVERLIGRGSPAQGAGLLGLAFAYGATWALTIREPSRDKGVVQTNGPDERASPERP